MPWFTNTATLKIIDCVAILFAQAYQLARCRLASTASSTLRLMMERDELLTEVQWLKRELEILRSQRAAMVPRKRPAYSPEQRIAILQLMRQRGWSIAIVCKRFVLHPQSVRKWIHYTVAAILDGATRRLLCLHVYRKRPNTQQLLRLISKSASRYGTPRRLITDHGGEFQKQFKDGLNELGIKHIRGSVRMPNFNGKIERFFRTLRIWQRAAWLLPMEQNLQKRCDFFRLWYNKKRSHQSLDGLTPDKAWNNIEHDEPIPIRSTLAIPHSYSHSTQQIQRRRTFAYDQDQRGTRSCLNVTNN